MISIVTPANASDSPTYALKALEWCLARKLPAISLSLTSSPDPELYAAQLAAQTALIQRSDLVFVFTDRGCDSAMLALIQKASLSEIPCDFLTLDSEAPTARAVSS